MKDVFHIVDISNALERDIFATQEPSDLEFIALRGFEDTLKLKTKQRLGLPIPIPEDVMQSLVKGRKKNALSISLSYPQVSPSQGVGKCWDREKTKMNTENIHKSNNPGTFPTS